MAIRTRTEIIEQLVGSGERMRRVRQESEAMRTARTLPESEPLQRPATAPVVPPASQVKK